MPGPTDPAAGPIEICVIFADPTFYLTEQVRALKAQTDPGFRVLYCPDSEIPGSILHSLLLDGRFRVVPSGKASIPVKRNFAARNILPDSKWVAYMDDDAFPPADWMANLKARLKQDPGLEILGGPSIAPLEAGWKEKAVGLARESFLGFGKRSRWSRPIKKAETVRELPTSNLVIRRSCFELADAFFNENMPIGEDMEWCRRMGSRHGKVIWMFPELFIYNHSRPLFGPSFLQFFRYGHHRMEIALSQRPLNASELFVALPPLGFTVLPVLVLFLPSLVLTLLAVYFAWILAEGLGRGKSIQDHLLRFLSIPFLHISYGSGLWARLLGGGKMDLKTYVRPETRNP